MDVGKPIELTGNPNVETRAISSQAFDIPKEGSETNHKNKTSPRGYEKEFNEYE